MHFSDTTHPNIIKALLLHNAESDRATVMIMTFVHCLLSPPVSTLLCIFRTLHSLEKYPRCLVKNTAEQASVFTPFFIFSTLRVLAFLLLVSEWQCPLPRCTTHQLEGGEIGGARGSYAHLNSYCNGSTEALPSEQLFR